MVCDSVGNPDFGQYSPLSVRKIVPVETLKEASKICKQYIADNDLGGGSWSGGQVYDVDGKIIANVSYNGRIWKGDNKKSVNDEDVVTEAEAAKKIYN